MTLYDADRQNRTEPQTMACRAQAPGAENGAPLLWRWPNFTPREIACRCCGETYADPAAMDALQRLRDMWGKPVRLTSAHRCASRNAAVGGAKGSLHLRLAFDCACPAHDQRVFAALAARAGFRGVIRYPLRGFVHLDRREKPYTAINSQPEPNGRI